MFSIPSVTADSYSNLTPVLIYSQSIIELALNEPELSRREVAVAFTERECKSASN